MLNLIANMVCSFFATLSFCILFNIPKRFYVFGGLNGMLGWMCYFLIAGVSSAPLASFVGSIVITFFARVFSAWKKCPATEFLIPGIIPLVPGAGIYYTAYYFVINDLTLATAKGIESLKVAFAIVVGMVFIISLPGKWFQPVLNGKRKQRYHD